MITIKPPTYPIQHEVELPGSKSISNRLLILRAISKLPITFKNLSDSDDTVTLAKALGHIQHKRTATIDVGHAGTDMRFLTSLLAVTDGEWILTGSLRMQNRPIGELVTALNGLGAEISYMEKAGYPPLKIKGKILKGGELEIDGSISSQFISALLLIAPSLKNGLVIRLKGEVVSRPYILMTVELLKQFGVSILADSDLISVKPSPNFELPTPNLSIESDWSAASYWYSITALNANAEVILKHLESSSLQADSVLPKLYDKLGVKTEFIEGGIKLSNQPVTVTEFNYDFTDCPDIAQTIAVTCLGLGIKAKLTGLKTLKIKESDRISALKSEFEKFGNTLSITNDSITLVPNSELRTPNSELITYHDHRMALSFAPIALKCGEIKIDDPEVINKSYPAFWDDLQEAGFDVE